VYSGRWTHLAFWGSKVLYYTYVFFKKALCVLCFSKSEIVLVFVGKLAINTVFILVFKGGWFENTIHSIVVFFSGYH
jgi:hypothetical protein